MKAALTTLLIFSFIGVAVFSIFAMGHGHELGSCLLATAGRAPCPQIDPLGFVAFHSNIFKSFSTAIFDIGFLTVAFLLIAFLSAVVSRLYNSGFLAPAFDSLQNFPANADFLSLPAREQELFWLSLHENSPALI